MRRLCRDVIELRQSALQVKRDRQRCFQYYEVKTMNYVIGDVHGCYYAMIRLLEKLHLTEEDRVFFVGDFVDRAPNNEQMLKTNQWVCDHITENGQFQAVLGNHDLAILDTYHELAGYEGTPMMSLLVSGDVYESLGRITKKFRTLPLFLECEAGGFKNIITHSWLCDASGNSVPADDGRVGEDCSVETSLWDRVHSITDIPVGCRVIHGHTITSCSCYGIEQRKVQSRIAFQGATNVNVDCGCFMGLANGGNLAAFRLEDGAEFYAYDFNDVIAECRELARLSRDPYRLEDYQIFMVCNPFREQVFLYDNSDYTKYALDSVIRDLGIDCFDKEEFFAQCKDSVRRWRSYIKRNCRRDGRFVVWEG